MTGIPVPAESMLVQPVVLSGGSGTRLWPLSRDKYPQQLLSLVGDDSLLQATVRRTEGIAGVTLTGAWVINVAEETNGWLFTERIDEHRRRIRLDQHV